MELKDRKVVHKMSAMDISKNDEDRGMTPGWAAPILLASYF